MPRTSNEAWYAEGMPPLIVTPFATAEISPDLLFHVVGDAYGNRLALVFGNHAPGGACPFYSGSLCHHCDIGRGEGAAFDVATNVRRLEWYQSIYAADMPTVAHLVIYNSGSVLNPMEMPFEFLKEVLSMANGITSIKEVSLDSRESYVTSVRLLRVAESLRPDQRVRVILGVESANEQIRNGLLQKRMPLQRIEHAFTEIATAASQIGADRFGVDVNILVGGPGTTDSTAASDAAGTATFAMTRCPLPVDFNIHPYYRSSRGSGRFPTHSRCSRTVLIEALEAVSMVSAQQQRRPPRIFIGLNHEGHDSEGDHPDLRSFVGAIHDFNTSQDLGELKSRMMSIQ